MSKSPPWVASTCTIGSVMVGNDIMTLGAASSADGVHAPGAPHQALSKQSLSGRRPREPSWQLRGFPRASCSFVPAAAQSAQVAVGLALCVVTSRVIVSRRPLRDRVSEPVACIVLAAAAGNLGLIPLAHGVYDVVGVQLLPLACSLFLFGADLNRCVV